MKDKRASKGSKGPNSEDEFRGEYFGFERGHFEREKEDGLGHGLHSENQKSTNLFFTFGAISSARKLGSPQIKKKPLAISQKVQVSSLSEDEDSI